MLVMSKLRHWRSFIWLFYNLILWMLRTCLIIRHMFYFFNALSLPFQGDQAVNAHATRTPALIAVPPVFSILDRTCAAMMSFMARPPSLAAAAALRQNRVFTLAEQDAYIKGLQEEAASGIKSTNKLCMKPTMAGHWLPQWLWWLWWPRWPQRSWRSWRRGTRECTGQFGRARSSKRSRRQPHASILLSLGYGRFRKVLTCGPRGQQLRGMSTLG